VVVRTWNGREYGPGGTTVFLPHAAVDQALRPDDDRRLLEHGCLNERQQPWRVPHPPQHTARAVGVHVLLTRPMVALATASRLEGAPDDRGQEPVSWQRWRRPRLDQTRDQVLVLAQGWYGICPMAQYAWLVGVHLKDRPPGIGTRQQILAQHGITAHG
jgi:hypothetical protein